MLTVLAAYANWYFQSFRHWLQSSRWTRSTTKVKRMKETTTLTDQQKKRKWLHLWIQNQHLPFQGTLEKLSLHFKMVAGMLTFCVCIWRASMLGQVTIILLAKKKESNWLAKLPLLYHTQPISAFILFFLSKRSLF